MPLYALTAGYAQQLMLQSQKAYSTRIVKVFHLLINYWIVLILFSILGLLFRSSSIPVSVSEFILNVLLIHKYGGIWWFLRTYVLLLLIPANIILFPIRTIRKYNSIILLCLAINIIHYSINRFGLLPIEDFNPFAASLLNEVMNLLSVLPCFWIGAFFCKHHTMTTIKKHLDGIVSRHYQKAVLVGAQVFLFFITIIVHKAVLMGVAAAITFILFNLYEKGERTKSIFKFLGKHSTNIWLVHMFFFGERFWPLAQTAQYPVFIFAFLLILCLLFSYVIMAIQKQIFKLLHLSSNS